LSILLELQQGVQLIEPPSPPSLKDKIIVLIDGHFLQPHTLNPNISSGLGINEGSEYNELG
jgi:hypothetical protein